MPAASPRPVTGVDHTPDSTLTSLITHLDAVHAFAHVLTSDAGPAAALTEQVYCDVTRDVWSTLGGHSLRDRLLARCLTIYKHEFNDAGRAASLGTPSPTLFDALASLPLADRAAVALVDRLGLSYAAGAAVLGISVDEFRTTLHGARRVLVRTYSALPGVGAFDSAR